jgi:glycolate oxidase
MVLNENIIGTAEAETLKEPLFMDQAVKQELSRAAGEGNFRDSPKVRWVYGADGTGRRHPPEAVVRARDTAQVSRVMAACQAHRVPVVARGAGSGLTGGALPVAGGVVLDMVGMDRILEISPADFLARVEPGVVTASLQEAADKLGLFYPPDPASVGFCTVGGNVAENAGGLRAVKYGVTRDYVMGLTAVLPDGRVFHTGAKTMKSVVGYDLTALLVGSEGTLAVITELTLRLMPKPEDKRTLSGLFRRVEDAAEAVQTVLKSGIRPTALEFVDRASLRAVESYAKLGLPDWAEGLVLIDVDGPPEVLGRQAGELAERLKQCHGEQVQVAGDQAAADSLWRARRALGPAMWVLSTGKFNEDIVVPLGRLGEMVRRIEEVSRAHGLPIPTFGHAGDGNLHVNVMFDSEDEASVKAAHEAVAEVFAHTLKLGGSLSGEHGVGTAKLGYVGAQLDPVAMDLMRAVKNALDPAGILNPHKAIPAPEALT